MCDVLLIVKIFSSDVGFHEKQNAKQLLLNFYSSLQSSFILIRLFGYQFDYARITSCIFHHFSKQAFSVDQFVRGSNLGDLPSFHNDHFIVVSDCVEPVSYCDHSVISELLFYALLNELISRHVHIRSRLVEYQKLVLPKQGSG